VKIKYLVFLDFSKSHIILNLVFFKNILNTKRLKTKNFIWSDFADGEAEYLCEIL
jgi:hypothetical protein